MGKIYDIRAKTGEYEKDGETKTRYATIGAVIETKNGGKMIKLDTMPMNWDGFAYLNEPYEKEEPKQTKDVVIDDIDDKPVDLSQIPF